MHIDSNQTATFPKRRLHDGGRLLRLTTGGALAVALCLDLAGAGTLLALGVEHPALAPSPVGLAMPVIPAAPVQ